MWTFIIITTICIIIGFRLVTEDFDWSLGEFVLLFFVILFSGMIGVLLSLGVAALIPGTYETTSETYKLEALQDNNGGASGSFFLGSGTIDSKMKYVFYYESDKNKYKMGQVDYEDATVTYVDEYVEPNVIKYADELTDAFINNFTVNFRSPWYDINIPKGSIKSGYMLDAQ